MKNDGDNGYYKGWTYRITVSEGCGWNLFIHEITMPNGDAQQEISDDGSYESAKEAIAWGHSRMRGMIDN